MVRTLGSDLFWTAYAGIAFAALMQLAVGGGSEDAFFRATMFGGILAVLLIGARICAWIAGRVDQAPPCSRR